MKAYFHAFSGGEVSPEFWGQIGAAEYRAGLARCRNFRILPHGPAQNRPGFEFVREVKNSAMPVRLLPFTHSAGQTMVMEVGHEYIRYHTQGATILNGAQPYETPTQYQAADIWGIKYTQSADVMTLVSTEHPPAEIRRTAPGGGFQVALAPINFSPTVSPPSVLSAVPTAGQTPGTPELHRYAVTRLAGADASQESALSNIVTCNNNLNDTGAENTISWLPVAGARCNVYKDINGLWGFVGAAGGSSFVDDNITPDLSKSPPIGEPVFFGSGLVSVPVVSGGLGYYPPGGAVSLTISDATGSGAAAYAVVNVLTGVITQVVVTHAGKDYTAPTFVANLPGGQLPIEAAVFGPAVLTGKNYPGAVAYYQQRRVFAGSEQAPQTVWMTRSGTESDFRYSIPAQDSDAVVFRAVSRQANEIRHLVPMSSLLALTGGEEWRIGGGGSEVVTPSSASVTPQSAIGAGNATPAVVNSAVIFAAARGGHARELAYSWQSGGFVTGDLSLRAPHLFDGFDIVDIAYSKAPYPIVWMVSSSGHLLGLTYVPDQQVGAWHWHDTDGAFESVACVAEGDEDVLYAVVRRVIVGQTKRYIERMRPRPTQWSAPSDAFFVDSGLSYSGPPVSSVSGLEHLEGKRVAILADGAIHASKTVQGGAVALDAPASVVHVGLPIIAQLQTLPLAMQIDGAGQGRPKNVSRLWLRVKDAGASVRVGPSFDPARMAQIPIRTNEPFGSPPALQTQTLDVVVPGGWQLDGQLCVEHTGPTPLTVVSMAVDLALGG